MKFLLFNIAVAAALIYLLATDRAEVQDAAGRIHDVASEMKAAGSRVVDRGRRWVGRSDAATPAEPRPAVAPRVQKPTADDAVAPAATAGTAPLADGPAAAASAKSRAGAAAGPKVPALAPERGEPAADDEDLAALKRRDEILRGIDPAILAPAAERAPEAQSPALSPEERRRQLYALSEEMELFYARTLGN